MPKNRIEINGTIDRWGYGSNYFRWQLKDCGEGPVTVSVTQSNEEIPAGQGAAASLTGVLELSGSLYPALASKLASWMKAQAMARFEVP